MVRLKKVSGPGKVEQEGRGSKSRKMSLRVNLARAMQKLVPRNSPGSPPGGKHPIVFGVRPVWWCAVVLHPL